MGGGGPLVCGVVFNNVRQLGRGPVLVCVLGAAFALHASDWCRYLS